jgi:hypothetical protein
MNLVWKYLVLTKSNLPKGASHLKREFSTTSHSLSLKNFPTTTSHSAPIAMDDSDGLPLFAFQDLDYIPSGFSGVLAPYIETTAGTMRAAATLMRLGLSAVEDGKESGVPSTHQQVLCDLGCGDGYFRNQAFLSPLFDPPWASKVVPSHTAAMHRSPESVPMEPFIVQIN